MYYKIRGTTATQSCLLRECSRVLRQACRTYATPPPFPPSLPPPRSRPPGSLGRGLLLNRIRASFIALLANCATYFVPVVHSSVPSSPSPTTNHKQCPPPATQKTNKEHKKKISHQGAKTTNKRNRGLFYRPIPQQWTRVSTKNTRVVHTSTHKPTVDNKQPHSLGREKKERKQQNDPPSALLSTSFKKNPIRIALVVPAATTARVLLVTPATRACCWHYCKWCC